MNLSFDGFLVANLNFPTFQTVQEKTLYINLCDVLPF